MTEQAFEILRALSPLAGMSDEDLHSLVRGADVVRLQPGETLFHEGDDGDSAYVIYRGEVEILKSSGGSEIHLSDRGPGEVIGEIALLLEERRSASVRAKSDTELLRITHAQLETLVNSSVTASQAVYAMILERWRNTESKLRHSARMAQLGTLSAGLAHELNNPAAALESAVLKLPDTLRRRDEAMRELDSASLPDPTPARIRALLEREDREVPRLTGLGRADREDEVEAVMERLGVTAARALSPGVVDLDLSDGDVATLAEGLSGDQLAAALAYLSAERRLSDLCGELHVGAKRISELVSAMKRYTFLDQAPVQSVDVVEQIENTLVVLGSALRGISIERAYPESVPEIDAFGSELAQVWSALLDNAAFAVRQAGREPGTITVRVEADDAAVRVQIEDDGTGIPEEIRDRVFDPFFTTKPPGAGQGLGLHTCHSIVSDRHGGTLEVDSGDGWTRFTVSLPLRGAAG